MGRIFPVLLILNSFDGTIEHRYPDAICRISNGETIVVISYKYPIFPNKATQQKLAETLDACRWLHNKLLERMNDAREKGVKLKTYDTKNMIPSLKLENPKLNMVSPKYFRWSTTPCGLTSKDFRLLRRMAER